MNITMKRIFLLVFLSLFICNFVLAASTADVTVKVTVRFLSVTVDVAEYNFGFMDTGEVKVAESAITVTNNSNCGVDFQLKLTNPPGWTAVQSGIPGEDRYMLSGIFRNNQPASGDYLDNEDAISTNFVSASGATFAKDGDPDSEKGFDVAKNTTRKLWLRFFAPSSTAIGTEQLIRVSVKVIGI